MRGAVERKKSSVEQWLPISEHRATAGPNIEDGLGGFFFFKFKLVEIGLIEKSNWSSCLMLVSPASITRPSFALMSSRSDRNKVYLIRSTWPTIQHWPEGDLLSVRPQDHSPVAEEISAQENNSGDQCWTLRVEPGCCQEGDASGEPAGAIGVLQQQPLSWVQQPIESNDRYFIQQSLKWFTLAGCLFRLIGNAAPVVDGRFLSYPSQAHSQTRLMVATCVTARVLATHWPQDWSPVLHLTPTPRVELLD